jgi:hypothetical protein
MWRTFEPTVTAAAGGLSIPEDFSIGQAGLPTFHGSFFPGAKVLYQCNRAAPSLPVQRANGFDAARFRRRGAGFLR